MGIYTYIRMSHALENSQAHYRKHDIQSSKHVLRQFNPAPNFIRTDCNICAYVDSSLFLFPPNILNSSVLTNSYGPAPRIHLGLFNLHVVMIRAKNMNYERQYYANFFSSCYPVSLSLKYSSRHFVPETLIRVLPSRTDL
jgi:hypothetical protein